MDKTKFCKHVAREYYFTNGSASYSNETFTVTAGTGYFAASQTYRLIYVY